MANRDVNKVILIGNLTRDPDVRYTPQGTAVANFTIATNRSWVSEGTEKEAVDFHNVVSWNKLAELCGQLLQKGTKTYVEGRLQTRDWVGDDGVKRYKTEVNIDEMIVLGRGRGMAQRGAFDNSGSSASTKPADNKADETVSAADDEDIDIDKLLDEINEEADTEKQEKKEKEVKKEKKPKKKK